MTQKVYITVITTLETDWPQEATLSVVIKSYIGNWILNVGQTVPLSESHCSFVLSIEKRLIFQVSVTLNTAIPLCNVQYLSEK